MIGKEFSRGHSKQTGTVSAQPLRSHVLATTTRQKGLHPPALIIGLHSFAQQFAGLALSDQQVLADRLI